MKKILNKETILYIIFGAITTFVNLFTFYILNKVLNWNENIANLISIILAILVAFFTNRNIVFQSNAKTTKEKLNEFVKFILGRSFTLLVEFIGGYILFKLPIPNIITKIFLTIIVIILNYFISKFYAFKKK